MNKSFYTLWMILLIIGGLVSILYYRDTEGGSPTGKYKIYAELIPYGVRRYLAVGGIILMVTGFALLSFVANAEKVVTAETVQTEREYLVPITNGSEGARFYETNEDTNTIKIVKRAGTEGSVINFKDRKENFKICYDCPVEELPYTVTHIYSRKWQMKFKSICLYPDQGIDVFNELHLHPQQTAGL